MRNNKTKHFVWLALLSAMAITLSLVESIFIGPLLFGILRIGLANIIALITIKLLGVRDMIIVNTMRVVISTLMQGTIFGSVFWISLGGVVLSSIVLIILDHFHASLLFTSILCAVAHSCGSVLHAAWYCRFTAISAAGIHSNGNHHRHHCKNGTGENSSPAQRNTGMNRCFDSPVFSFAAMVKYHRLARRGVNHA